MIAVTFVVGLMLGAVIGRWVAVVAAAFAWPALAIVMWAGDAVGLWGAGRSQENEFWVIAGLFAIYVLTAIVGATLGVLARLGIRARPGHRSPTGA